MLGQTDTPEVEEVNTDPRSYQSKSVGWRMVIISAGVIMNIIFGFALFASAYALGVPYTPGVIGSAFPGMPAWKAGVQEGDRLVAVNGTPRDDFEDIRRSVMLANPKKDSINFTMSRRLPDGSRSPGRLLHPTVQRRHQLASASRRHSRLQPSSRSLERRRRHQPEQFASRPRFRARLPGRRSDRRGRRQRGRRLPLLQSPDVPEAPRSGDGDGPPRRRPQVRRRTGSGENRTELHPHVRARHADRQDRRRSTRFARRQGRERRNRRAAADPGRRPDQEDQRQGRLRSDAPARPGVGRHRQTGDPRDRSRRPSDADLQGQGRS